MSTNLNLEIQSDHFRNGRSLSIEGCFIEIIDTDLNGNCVFNSHFSDDSRQDVYTTHTHMILMLNVITNQSVEG